ncbi:MAG TPA: inositol monophosphatase family protein [Acidimicrobiia bacterium]|nr:inositol monophosphatase family protein [Acidimicrobiia bacterium]
MTTDDLLGLLTECAAAVEVALCGVTGGDRRSRTDRAGQYALDLVADAAALEVLGRAPVAVLSEESGWSGPRDAPLTVVLDPVDGSTNASRHIPYWATSACVLDGDGPLVALVVNQATAVAYTAVRGEGARRAGEPITPGKVERVEDALVALSGRPGEWLPWKQFRALGSAALSLCDLAAGAVDGLVDGGAWHAPWDYLGGLLICREAGAEVVDAAGRELVVADADARRQLLAAATPALLEDLRRALPEPGRPT